MASTYSDLKVELIGTGEQTGTWGTTTNNNLSIALGEAITGSADVSFSGSDVTLTLTDTNAAQTARNLRLNLTGTSGGARNLILGSGCQIEKLYLINNGLADAVTVKNTTGTGIAVPAGTSMFVFNNGTNVVAAITSVTTLTNSALTSGRVTYATTNGLLTDSANLTFNGTTLTANTIGAFTLGGTISGGGNQINNVIIGASTPLAGSFTTLSASGVATFSAGTVSAPAITTTGDTNTGIFFPAADTIAFTEGGVEAMRIDSSGNVGIGVTPSAWSLLTPVQVKNAGFAGYLNRAYMTTNAFFNGTDWKYIASDTASFYAQQNGSHEWYTASSGTAGATATMSQRMIIDGSGNVGIGTSSPSTRLHVFSTTDAAQLKIEGDGTNVRAQINTVNDHGDWLWGVLGGDSSGDGLIYTDGAKNLRVFTNNTERMRITSGGDLLVNTTGTGSYTDGKIVAIASGTSPALTVKNLSSSQFVASFWNNGTSGDNIFQQFITETSPSVRGSITYNRGGGLTAYNTTSDARLKENIVDAPSALTKIDSVKVRSFDWKENGLHIDYGVIAQELIESAPECVTKGDDGTEIKQTWQVDTAALVPALIKAIQELKAELDSVKAELKTLKGA